jgi:acyl carrier protein
MLTQPTDETRPTDESTRPLEATLREIVSRIGEVEASFSADADLTEDLAIDSFRAAEIVFEIERTLKIKLDDASFGEVKTFSDMVQLVRSVTG